MKGLLNEMYNFLILGDVKTNNIIGMIDSWGPHLHVSFDLIVRSFPPFTYSSILAFRANGLASYWFENNCPSIIIDTNGDLRFIFNSVSGIGLYMFAHQIQLNSWYNVILEQKIVNGKVKE